MHRTSAQAGRAVRPVPADESDLLRLVEMRDAAAHWQLNRGVVQWDPGEVTVDDLRAQVVAGELFVARDGCELVGAVRLLWSDPFVWDTDPANSAGYVHGLIVATHGNGWGAGLLSWAETRIAAAGKSLVRLDCVATNHRLRHYYLEHGYGEAGYRGFADPRWRPVMRFEKHLG